MVLDPLSKLGVFGGTGKAGLFLPLQFLVFPGFPSISDWDLGNPAVESSRSFEKHTRIRPSAFSLSSILSLL
jgi:hypothetical protein